MRYELKFRFNEHDQEKFCTWLNSIKNLNKVFEERSINNIYYDDVNYSSANDNIIGLPYREKYRMRWYKDINNNISKPLFEIKIKKNRLNYKKIFPINENIENLYLDKIFSLKNNYFNFNPINYKLSSYHNLLKPVLKNIYSREYYLFENKIRITVDKPCKYFDLLSNKKKKYFQNFNILEIKFEPKDILLAKNLTRNIPFNLSRFSKYIHGLLILKKLNFY